MWFADLFLIYVFFNGNSVYLRRWKSIRCTGNIGRVEQSLKKGSNSKFVNILVSKCEKQVNEQRFQL